MRNPLSLVAQEIDSGRYETDGGDILLPKLGIIARGEYITYVNGKDPQVSTNLVPDQGLNYLVNVGFHTLSKINNWYLAPFAGSTAPAANWTAANFASVASEISSNTEGYTETTRQQFVTTAAPANIVDNLSSLARITIITASQLSITGLGLLSNNVKASTSGVLGSATKFPQARILLNGDTFDIGYRVQLNAA